jgi:hypothetical protein
VAESDDAVELVCDVATPVLLCHGRDGSDVSDEPHHRSGVPRLVGGMVRDRLHAGAGAHDDNRRGRGLIVRIRLNWPTL